MKHLLLACTVLLLCGCKSNVEQQTATDQPSQYAPDYASGFEWIEHEGYTELIISEPWPDAEESFRYALVEDAALAAQLDNFDAVVKIPVERIVVTSTTHIPSLEMLGIGDRLIGFPNLDYISSEQTRKRIEAGQVTELGMNDALNTELMLDLEPDLLVTFAVSGGNTAVTPLEQAGIPVLYNADWTETHPLGKAEWIKFFGLLTGKKTTADSIFNGIVSRYETARELATQATSKPTVLSGAMYKDVWYLPAGESWAAQFLVDAQATYLWADSPGSGSLSLGLESVLEQGQQADFWIGPGQFNSRADLAEAHSVYTEFAAFETNNIYSFTTRKGATGGVVYYELAPNRPDLVLQDMIHILHPELQPDHQLYFFSRLGE